MGSISPALPAATTLIALVGLLVAKRVRSQRGVWLTKPVAAAGFVALALTLGAPGSTYGRWITLGLVLCFLGDLLLIPNNRPAAFKAGIASFLLGHVAYTAAFSTLDANLPVAATSALVCAATAVLVLRWLRPHVDNDLRLPVYAYVAVISCMLVMATSCALAESRPDILAGALLFYLSDLAVARDRFVAPGFWNGAWGLPAYFIGQLLLAYGSGP